MGVYGKKVVDIGQIGPNNHPQLRSKLKINMER
jgi:hypothetical protein